MDTTRHGDADEGAPKEPSYRGNRCKPLHKLVDSSTDFCTLHGDYDFDRLLKS